MKTILTTILFLLALTGCKIDLTIIGLGAVKTDSGSIDCATGTTGDCHQEYVTNANDCTVAGNCTVVGTNGATETFNALPSDDSSFGGWGDICFGAANLQCAHTITPDYAADPDAQLNVTATFDPDPTPQNATYLYNAQGQRASKTVNGVTTHFVYSDVDGQLLGEYNAVGNPIREYMYLEGERVAMYDYTTVEPKDSTNQKAIVYLHNNQVGQVQYAFNSDGQMIYERVQTPFGETMGEVNAYGVQMPVRFPGQYYDSETGFSDNWNRAYDSSLGRYVQSDPIGLRGGVNTFGYVRQNPIRWIDKRGLDAADWYDATGGGNTENSQIVKTEQYGDYSEALIKVECIVNCPTGDQLFTEYFGGTGSNPSDAITGANDRMNKYYDDTDPWEEACPTKECEDEIYVGYDENGNMVVYTSINCKRWSYANDS